MVGSIAVYVVFSINNAANESFRHDFDGLACFNN